jgi:hypothetical protein
MNSTNLLLLLCWTVLFNSAAVRRANATEVIEAVHVQQQRNMGEDPSPARTDFRKIMTGEMMTKEGTRYPFHSWKSADGVTVTSSILRFGSVTQARKAFSERLNDASRVIERMPRVNRAGRKTGERAVAVFSYQDKGKEKQFAAILWTEDKVFHDVESVSLRHAQAFEREFYPVPNRGRLPR